MVVIFKQKGRKKYQVKFNIDGKRKTLVLNENKTSSSHIAETIESLVRYKEASLPIPPELSKMIPSFSPYIAQKLGEWRVIERGYAKTIHELIDEYALDLKGKRRTDKHIKKTISYITKCLDSLCYVYPKDIKSDGIQSFLNDVVCKGLSARTYNYYLQAVKQFNNWMDIKGIPVVELRHIRKLSEKIDKRDISRVLHVDECKLLLTTFENKHHGLVPFERKLVYLFGLEAGLRWGEITKLIVADIDLQNRKFAIRPEIEKAGRGGGLNCLYQITW